jgi:hypothetical protein
MCLMTNLFFFFYHLILQLNDTEIWVLFGLSDHQSHFWFQSHLTFLRSVAHLKVIAGEDQQESKYFSSDISVQCLIKSFVVS